MKQHEWTQENRGKEWDSLSTQAKEKLQDLPPDHEDHPMMPDSYEEIIKIAEKEYASFMDPFVEKLNDNEIMTIDGAFDFSFVAGNETAVEVLSAILNIEPPEVVIFDQNKSPQPFYSKRDGKIYIPDKSNDDLLVNKIDKISHELWHAYQYQMIKNNGRRADIYRDNFANYKPLSAGVKNYFCQPVELEAYTFGGRITDKYFDIVLSNEWQKYEQTEKIIEECREDGNEHLIDTFEEDNRLRWAKIEKMTGGEYFKKRLREQQKGE
ncbi:hypothetical protein IKF25_00760 [Candidatus Saccharibacteria bacterium]|nr:hypothetical protein [Candidatus Saccharibacteria bacterium]